MKRVLVFAGLLAACSSVISDAQPVGTAVELLQDPWNSQGVTPPPASSPWLVALCQAADYTSIPSGDTQAFYQQYFATQGQGGAYDYWARQSAGNVSMAGTFVSQWTPVSGTTSAVQGDGRRWLTSPAAKTTQVQQCVNTVITANGLNANNYYNFIALWNVIVGAQGGISTTVGVLPNQKTALTVALDVGANPGTIEHEMGHGWSLDHSFNDTFIPPCTGDGRAGSYGDTNDIMSWSCAATHQQSVCINAWEVATPSPDCTSGPGLNLWNLYNLGWVTSNTSVGYAGYGWYQTPYWASSFSGSITIVPRSRPDLSGYRGIYIPAYNHGGYVVELDSSSNDDTNISTRVTIRRWFFNNSIPYLVSEVGGTQTDATHPFVDNSEGALSIAVISLSATSATISVNYNPGPGIWWNQDFGYPLVNNNTTNANNNGNGGPGDWAPGAYKGECWPGQPIVGVSKFTSGAGQSHGMQCGQRTLPIVNNPPGTYGNPNHTMVMQDYDNRCDTDANTDWDPGNYKLECCSNEIVSGISQTASGALDSVLCETATVTHSSCEAQVYYSNDSPGFTGYDWDPGYYKGQCPAGQYVAGISTPAYGSPFGVPHAILCCSP